MPTNITGQNTTKKKEKQINLLSKRKLPMAGKAIVLNSIILSKTRFLSNIFHIPKNIEKQLHKLIFQYIWYYEKTKPISRTTLYLPKEE